MIAVSKNIDKVPIFLDSDMTSKDFSDIKGIEEFLTDDDIFDSIHRKHKSGFRNILPINVRRIYFS